MTEADNHPSQRRRSSPDQKTNRPDDVSSLLKAALVAGLIGLSVFPASAVADVPLGASLATSTLDTGQARAVIYLPSVLDTADVVRYRRIFALQAEGRWSDADKLISAIDNKLLLGHVLAQRYLHPRYRSRYQELARWLKHYGDHPDAKRIHTLALKRKPAQAAPPPMPTGGDKPPPAGLKIAPTEPPAERWAPAMDAFRQKRYAAAAKQFEAVTRLPKVSPWVASAGAFWAARAHMLGGHPHQVTQWLHKAAQHPLTFYGLLARETLGIDDALPLRDPSLKPTDARALAADAAGARAIALLQVNQPQRAEPELAAIKIGNSPALARAIAALANYGNMPALSLRVGNRASGLDKAEHDAAIYPVPAWEPAEGYEVDRALVYAIMRRESSFNPDVRNGSGAAGLMQLMPATARALAGRPLHANTLADPETNISLGQRYINHLLADGAVAGNLIFMAAAYNAGPGNVAKWQREAFETDPLLFIESLPSRETRLFIQTVLTDFWIYRMRLGQANYALTTLASGRWPMYAAQDNRDRGFAESKSSAEIKHAGN